MSPLHKSAQYNNDPEIPLLLLCHGAAVNSLNMNRQSALTHACSEGNIDVARVLIEWGADVNTVDVNGVTPLGVAAGSNYKEVVALLLSKGAKINKVSKYCWQCS